MKKAILATILGLATTVGCASTGGLKAEAPMYPPEKEVYAFGFRISRGAELPKNPAEYNFRMKLVYDPAPEIGMPDFRTDIITINCRETHSIVPIVIGPRQRQFANEEDLGFLHQIDRFAKSNDDTLESMVEQNFDLGPGFDMFDYTKPRTVTLYLHKGPYSEESKIDFADDEKGIEIRYFTEGKDSIVQYVVSGSSNLPMHKKKAGKKNGNESEKEPPLSEQIKAGQEVFNSLANSFQALRTQYTGDYCKAE